MKNLKLKMDETLAEIETLSKKARFESNVDLDMIAREISSLASRLKDLSYEIRLGAVRS